MDVKVLKLYFMDKADKQFILNIDDPKDNLTGQEVNAKMEDIISYGCFYNKGVPLVSAVAAKVVITHETELELA